MELLGQVKPSRKERELEFRKNIILDAAEEVFAECSYATASVEEIAKRSEISVGTLYNLFHSKEDIYRCAVSRSAETFFLELHRRVDKARGPNERMHATVEYFFEHFCKYERALRLYISATNGFQWDIKSKLQNQAAEHQREFFQRFVVICDEGISEGVFKSGIPAELMATTVLGIPHSFLMFWVEQTAVDLMGLLPAALMATDRVTGAAAD